MYVLYVLWTSRVEHLSSCLLYRSITYILHFSPASYIGRFALESLEAQDRLLCLLLLPSMGIEKHYVCRKLLRCDATGCWRSSWWEDGHKWAFFDVDDPREYWQKVVLCPTCIHEVERHVKMEMGKGFQSSILYVHACVFYTTGFFLL